MEVRRIAASVPNKFEIEIDLRGTCNEEHALFNSAQIVFVSLDERPISRFGRRRGASAPVSGTRTDAVKVPITTRLLTLYYVTRCA